MRVRRVEDPKMTWPNDARNMHRMYRVQAPPVTISWGLSIIYRKRNLPLLLLLHLFLSSSTISLTRAVSQQLPGMIAAWPPPSDLVGDRLEVKPTKQQTFSLSTLPSSPYGLRAGAGGNNH